jgi:DNA-binding winged helix-turn-helix (wHTH) protein/tetratricopeptide (TPR) repeat protein
MSCLRFGTFEFDLGSGELRRAGLRVRLSPQARTVLEALLETPGDVVERGELQRRLWKDGTFVDFERSLNFAVHCLRQALGDATGRSRFVATVPGRGYRFLVPVTGGLGPDAEAPAVPARPGGPRPALVAALSIAALFLFSGQDRTPHRDGMVEALEARARALCGVDGWRDSVPLFTAALARDPSFAAAHAGLARAYLALGEAGALDPDQAFPQARASAVRALALEERADARLVLGRVRFAYDWDRAAAERDLRRSLELRPESSEAWRSLARVLSERGAHGEAIAAAKHAEALDPASLVAVEEAAWCFYRARDFEAAARRFRRVAERRPEEAHQSLFSIYRLAGRDADAFAQADEVMRLAGTPSEARRALARLAPRPAADAYLRGSVDYLRRESERQRVAPERFALLFAALDDRREAIAWLTRAAAERSPDLLPALRDPVLDPLRTEPAFVSLARRVGSSAVLDPT